MLPVRAYRPARADIWGVYRYLASYDIGSRVGLRAAPGRVLEVSFETSLSVETTYCIFGRGKITDVGTFSFR